MKPFVLTLSLISALLFANCTRGQKKPDHVSPGTLSKAFTTGFEKAAEPSTAPRRLETVTWNSVRHELVWEVSKGPEKKDPDGDDSNTYKPVAKDRYQIDMDNATMTFNGKTRRFSETEAANVRTLMDVIARYAVESTIWWEEGQGEPLDGDRPPAPARPKTNDKPKTVGSPSQVVRLAGALEQLAALMTPPVPGSSQQAR